MTKIQINDVVRDMTAEEQAEFDARQVTPPTAFEQSMIDLRQLRNKLLQESDWSQGGDVPDTTKTKWQTYRQTLRDLPANQTPSDWFLTNITWPTKPE